LDKAFRILVQSNSKPATLIAVHKAKYFAPEPGQLSMGPGGFVEALEFASGIKSLVVGKVSVLPLLLFLHHNLIIDSSILTNMSFFDSLKKHSLKWPSKS